MRKITLFASIILFNCALCTLSGNAQPIYMSNKIKYTGIEELKTYNLYNKKDNPACNLRINFFYPEIENNKDLQERLQSLFISSFFGNEYAGFSPQKAVKSYSKTYVENYKNAFEQSGYQEEIKQVKENGEDFYTFEKKMQNTILFNQGNLVSQVINIYENTGGAHGASSTKGMVIDINTGKKLEYEDVFQVEMEEAISELLLFELMSARNYPNREALAEDGFDFEVIRPTGNFVADDKGVTFIYNPYELGAYILGIVEIAVPYSDLFLYVKPESTLYRWARNHIPIDEDDYY
ncbi:MAG: DUF3298 and DUF4163 domain-containing protein [Candidatus Symbiothrix sp.]|nr:DUF3298 and DUF4163 domain-containing protein [Candidatus Symbiothrix sp.]